MRFYLGMLFGGLVVAVCAYLALRRCERERDAADADWLAASRALNDASGAVEADPWPGARDV